MRWLVNGIEYLKSKKNWCVRIFKCLNHDEIVGLRICMSKEVDLSNMLFSAIHFAPTWWIDKNIQNIWFWFLITWNNVNQLQRNGSYIRMSNGCISVVRIWPRIPPQWHECVYTHFVHIKLRSNNYILPTLSLILHSFVHESAKIVRSLPRRCSLSSCLPLLTSLLYLKRNIIPTILDDSI